MSLEQQTKTQHVKGPFLKGSYLSSVRFCDETMSVSHQILKVLSNDVQDSTQCCVIMFDLINHRNVGKFIKIDLQQTQDKFNHVLEELNITKISQLNSNWNYFFQDFKCSKYP